MMIIMIAIAVNSSTSVIPRWSSTERRSTRESRDSVKRTFTDSSSALGRSGATL